jgi:hypothetical protein
VETLVQKSVVIVFLTSFIYMAYIYCFSYGLSDCRIIATAPFIWVTDNSARKREQLGPYEKTTRTINNYCCLTYFVNFKGEGTHTADADLQVQCYIYIYI